MTPFVFLLLMGLLTPGVVGAQTASPSLEVVPEATTSPDVTPSLNVSATPISSVSSPNELPFHFTSKAPITWLRFRRFLTRNQLKRSELTLSIGQALLAKAQEEEDAGRNAEARSVLDSYNREMIYLQTIIDVLQTSSNDPQMKTFLGQLTEDKTSQLLALEALQPVRANEITRKIIEVRAQTVRDIVKLLEHPNLTDSERQARLDRIMDKYTRKETRIEGKIEKRLSLSAELASETEDKDVEQELEESDEASLTTVENLQTNSAEELIDKISHLDPDKRLALLIRMKDRVPEAALPKVIEALNNVFESEAKALDQSPQTAKTLLSDIKGSDAIRDEIIAALKARVGEEAKTKITEFEGTLQQKRKKQEIEQLKKSGGKKLATPKPSSTPKSGTRLSSPKPSTDVESEDATGTTSSPSPEPLKSEITIKIRENKFDQSSFTVAKDSNLVIRLENGDTGARSISVSNISSPVSLGAGQRISLDPFLITGTITFSATLNGTTYTGHIYVK